MEFASASGFAHSTFFTFTPRFRYFRAWWGWWLITKGAAVRVSKPLRTRAKHSMDLADILAAGARGDVAHVDLGNATALGYHVAGKRFARMDVDAIRRSYPVTTWRVSGDVLFAFVGTVPVGFMSALWDGLHPMPRRHRARVAP